MRSWGSHRPPGACAQVLLIVAITIAAANPSAQPAPPVEPPVTIHLFQRGYLRGSEGLATRLTDAAVAAFHERRPDVAVKVVGVPWGRHGDLKLRTALLARRRIDCFRLAHDQLPAFIPREGRLLAPADPWLTDADRADFGAAALEAVTRDGHVMAWPLWSTAISLLAAPEALENAGLHPPVDRPWTWAEFVAALEALRATGIQPLTAASRPPLFEWRPLLVTHCGPLFTAEAPREDGGLPLAQGLADALERVHTLHRGGLLAPTFGGETIQDVRRMFAERRVAMILSSPGLIAEFTRTNVAFRILPVPVGELGRPITTGAFGCFAVVESGDRARVAAAHELARYLTSRTIAAEVEGWYLAPPVRRGVDAFYAGTPYAPLRAILPTAHYTVPPVSAGFMQTVLIPQLQAAALGEVRADRALEVIQSAARRRALR